MAWLFRQLQWPVGQCCAVGPVDGFLFRLRFFMRLSSRHGKILIRRLRLAGRVPVGRRRAGAAIQAGHRPATAVALVYAACLFWDWSGAHGQRGRGWRLPRLQLCPDREVGMSAVLRASQAVVTARKRRPSTRVGHHAHDKIHGHRQRATTTTIRADACAVLRAPKHGPHAGEAAQVAVAAATHLC